jgi:beta-lactamase class A
MGEYSGNKRSLILHSRIPLFYLIIIFLISAGILCWQLRQLRINARFKTEKQSQVAGCPDVMNQVRGLGYDLIHPLYLTDVPNESEYLQPLKNEINRILGEQEANGIISKASVYLRMINNGSWICINPEERFDPGSMMKVTMLINYLKHAEQQKDLLDKTIVFNGVSFHIPVPTFSDKTIENGKAYKVRDLLQSMIVHSDNYATIALSQLFPVESSRYIYKDLGISLTDDNDPRIRLTSVEYSRLFRVLYNSTYLDKDDCEYAMDLLTRSTFNYGITRYLPPNVKVAHKFGEQEDDDGRELGETGIVYNGENSYLLTIMTKGKDLTLMSNVLANISKLVFDQLH